MQKDNQKPILTSGNIAIWPPKKVGNDKTVYPVSFETSDKKRDYISVFANIAGYELKPEEILALRQGIPVKIEDFSQDKLKVCTIVNRGIEIKINEQEGKLYENNFMKLGVVFHRSNEVKQLLTYGINYNGSQISFFIESKDPETDRSIYLKPEDCFKLLDGQIIFKDDLQASLDYIEEIKMNYAQGEKIYHTARLNIEKLTLQQNFHLRAIPKGNKETKSIGV